MVMPDVLTKLEQRIVPGLNNTEIRKLLNLTPDQHNAMVIVNLRKSLSILEEYCERISQLVDLAIIAKKTNFENTRESYPRKYHDERMWYIELEMYLTDIFDYQNDLDELMNKIRRQESISNSKVKKARKTMRELVRSHKDLTEQSQQILNSS
ncbi:GSCOCT00014249001.2-RA-CDS, partial [Cotesia congregata]